MLTQSAFDRLLDRWIAEGRVAADQRDALRADVRAAGRIAHPATVIAVFAAVLVVLAALAFVAANWQEMPRGLRLGLLAGALLGTYGGAMAVFRSSLPQALGHALLLVGAGLFGVALALVSQMYHLGGELSDLLLTWGLGAAATALAGRSRPPLWLAGVLFVWMGLEGGDSEASLALGLTAALGLPLWRWRLGGEWVFLTLGLTFLGYSLLDWGSIGTPVVLTLHLLAWAVAAWADDGQRPWPGPVRAVNLILALGLTVLGPLVGGLGDVLPLETASATALLAAGAAALVWRAVTAGRMEVPEAVALLVLAALAATRGVVPGDLLEALWIAPAAILLVAVLLAAQDARAGRKGRLTVAVAVFLTEALVIYDDHDAGLMASAGFFLVGGVVLGVVSVIAAKRGGEGTR